VWGQARHATLVSQQPTRPHAPDTQTQRLKVTPLPPKPPPQSRRCRRSRGLQSWTSALTTRRARPRRRVVDNRHSNRVRSMTYLHGECSYRRAEEEGRFNVGQVLVLSDPRTMVAAVRDVAAATAVIVDRGTRRPCVVSGRCTTAMARSTWNNTPWESKTRDTRILPATSSDALPNTATSSGACLTLAS